MSNGKVERETGCFYWVRTAGYHDEFTPLYFNKDKQFRLEYNDKTLFLSEHKLEQLFGKNCVSRKVDFTTDTCENPEEKNAFLPYLVDTDSGEPFIILFNPAINLGLSCGKVVPIDVVRRIKFIE